MIRRRLWLDPNLRTTLRLCEEAPGEVLPNARWNLAEQNLHLEQNAERMFRGLYERLTFSKPNNEAIVNELLLLAALLYMAINH